MAAESDLDLIPPELAEQSLSRIEIVLPYEAALQAVVLLSDRQVALLGWEAWLRYPDGRIGHPRDVIGSPSIEQLPDETWESYVARGADLCFRTIAATYKEWSVLNYKVTGGEICFCIAPYRLQGGESNTPIRDPISRCLPRLGPC